MTDVPPPQPSDEREPEAAPLPPWVPTLIGAVLVILAGLAVYTGLQYRNNTIVSVVKPRRVPAANTPAPPGEPQPGASLVFSGESGDNAPVAHPPVTGKSRATIVGTGHDVEATVRIWARRGMTTTVMPPDALVYVNDVAVGQANQLSTQPYEFPQAGSYNVRITAPGYRDRTYIVTAADNAKDEVATIQAKLERQ
ncbi:MAG TPA: PEGA domain-containing protein [Thermoanaerobaculia bacterium]